MIRSQWWILDIMQEANVHKIPDTKQKEEKKPVKQQIGASQNKKSQQALLAGVVKRKRFVEFCFLSVIHLNMPFDAL